jgi:hypothetical protein
VILLAGAGLLASGALAMPGQGATEDPIAAGFRDVPPEARLRMFWRIFGPAWSREEIEFQLEQLRGAGVGGVMTCFTYPVALDDPSRGIRNQRFLSPEFLETLRYAGRRARELGLEFGVCGGTGWPYGGPSVSLPDAAQRLRVENATLLPDGAGYQLPALREGEKYLAIFLGDQDVTALRQGNRLPLPLRARARARARSLSEEGLAPSSPYGDELSKSKTEHEHEHEHEPADHSLTASVFITGPTLMQVKRAALGGEGYVIDHFSRRAARRYLEAVVAPMVRALPEGGLRSLFCDSLEVYRANWTHDLPARFRRRRGYDLIPHLPALFDDAAPASPDLRFDFWRTLAELTESEFARPVHDWCRQRGIPFVLEPYGTPSMGFTGARYCDVPWGEQYEWKGFSFSRFAASGGHLTGKKIIGAEAWTWTGIPNRLADSLSDLKLCSDLHFLSGENELTGVDFPYSPRSEGAPGWTPYYGPVIGFNNPQWFCFPALAAYVNRCQWLLRQGEPVADVALYTPTEDAFAQGPTEQMVLDFHLRDRLATGDLTDEFGLRKAFQHHSDVIHTLLSHGYNFDGIDFFAVNRLARVRGRELVAGDGRYRIVLLPNLEGMDLAALDKIARFCRAGGTVIATRRLPDRVYGLGREGATQRLRERVAAMFGPGIAGGMAAHPYGRGRAIFVPDEREGLAAALAQSGIEPDLCVTPYQPEVMHVHRRLADRDFYFVANVSETEAHFTADCRSARRAATLWDPISGAIRSLRILRQGAGSARAELVLPPRGSVFVCFDDRGPRWAAGSGGEERQSESSAGGRSHSFNTLTQPLTATWHVTFEGPDAPPPRETRDLTSWTTWPGARFFSGHATYTTTFEAPEGPLQSCRLRFGQVREVARVRVNGHEAGVVWLPPLEVEIAPWLQPGLNRLEVTVGNLPVNRVLGLPEPDLTALNATYGERFPLPEEKKLMPEPAPSGLIGSVLLLSE